MRSLRPALLSALLLVTVLPLPTRAAPGTTSEPTASAAPTASSAEVVAAGQRHRPAHGHHGLLRRRQRRCRVHAARAGPPAGHAHRQRPVRHVHGRASSALVAIAGRGGIPEDAVAVTINVTVTGQSSAGFVAVGPTVSATPTTSTINLPRGDNRANGATVALNDNGQPGRGVARHLRLQTHLVVDVTGYFLPMTARRRTCRSTRSACSTRAGQRPVGHVRLGHRRAGRDRRPRGRARQRDRGRTSTSPMVAPTSSGYVSVGPTVTSAPKTSTLNVPRNDTRANGTTVALDDQVDWPPCGRARRRPGPTSSSTSPATTLPGDDGATFVPLAPLRLLDTRTGNGLQAPVRLGPVRGRSRSPGVARSRAMPWRSPGTSRDRAHIEGLRVDGPTCRPRRPRRPSTCHSAMSGRTTSRSRSMAGPTRSRVPGLEGPELSVATTRATTTPGSCSWPSATPRSPIPTSSTSSPPAGATRAAPIWAAKVSDNVADDENEPEVLFDALHHAREHLTIEQILDTFCQLTARYGDNSTIKNLVDKREVWFIFALNPDGWAYDLGGIAVPRLAQEPPAQQRHQQRRHRPQPELRLPLGLLRRLVRVDRGLELPRLGRPWSTPETRSPARLRRPPGHQRHPADHHATSRSTPTAS